MLDLHSIWPIYPSVSLATIVVMLTMLFVTCFLTNFLITLLLSVSNKFQYASCPMYKYQTEYSHVYISAQCGYNKFLQSFVICRERSGSVVECLTRDRGAVGSSLTGFSALCPWARHINR